MKVSVIVNAINFGGNAICIYLLGMGVEGVAIPTLISRAVGAFIILALAAQHEYVLHITPRSVTHLERGDRAKHFAHRHPSACENSLFQLGRVLVVSMISLFGTVHISANAVANNLDAVGAIIGQAMGLAIITVVGRCVGAQDMQQVVYYTKKLMLWDYIAQGIANAAVILSLGVVLNMYTLSPETRSLAAELVIIHCAHGYPDLAGGLCAAQRSARRQRRKVYDGRLGGLDARLAFGVQLDLVRQHGLGRRRRLVGHGH